MNVPTQLLVVLTFTATLGLGACGSVTDPGEGDDILRVRNGVGDNITVDVVQPDGTTTTLSITPFQDQAVEVSFGVGEVYTFNTTWNSQSFTGSCTTNSATVTSGAGEVEIFRQQPGGTDVVVNCTSNWVGSP